MGSLTPAVLARGVSYAHPSTGRGVLGVDLEVPPGQVVALVGPNGSGKSTLLAALATLARGSGHLELMGTRVGGNAITPLRRRMGVAFDVPAHFDELSGRANALFIARAKGVPHATAAQAVDGLLERFGLADLGTEAVAGYSFGTRRKLMLVEALAHEPELVLLDEPTVGLDASARATLWGLVRERAADGAAVVLATNELGDLAERVDRVVFLVGGRVVHDASPQTLLALVDGVTRIEIQVSGPAPDLGGDRPDVQLTATPQGLLALSRQGSAPLPALLTELLEAGAGVTAVAIRTPGLAEAFEALTGHVLLEPGSAESRPEAGNE